MQVLVVDDSRATRAVLRQILKALGFDVTEAGHGLEALERLKEMEKPDLVLVDWNMPEMNGPQADPAAKVGEVPFIGFAHAAP